MMREDFERNTGLYPSQKFYNVIEEHYMDYDGDQEEFCRVYLSNEDGLASKIQRDADMRDVKERSNFYTRIEALEEQIKGLTEKLEKEEEWKPYIDVDNVSQASYEKLEKAGGTHSLSFTEAKDILYRLFGFAPEKVTIVCSVPVYEVNRHGRLRKVGTFNRFPLYNATDWNYIRFDCGCMSYEYYNDNLRPFLQ